MLDYSALTVFSVFTTRATAQLVSDQVRVVADGVNLYSDTVFTVNSTKSYAGKILCALLITEREGGSMQTVH